MRRWLLGAWAILLLAGCSSAPPGKNGGAPQTGDYDPTTYDPAYQQGYDQQGYDPAYDPAQQHPHGTGRERPDGSQQ